jgi:hypothetical protein
MEPPRTIKCASFWDALVLGLMLEEQGAQVRPADEGAVSSMVASGALDGIRAAVAQLSHEFPHSGPVIIEGEDGDQSADTVRSAAPRDHITEETRVASPDQSQAVPQWCTASTAEGASSGPATGARDAPERADPDRPPDGEVVIVPGVPGITSAAAP